MCRPLCHIRPTLWSGKSRSAKSDVQTATQEERESKPGGLDTLSKSPLGMIQLNMRLWWNLGIHVWFRPICFGVQVQILSGVQSLGALGLSYFAKW